MTLSSDFSDLRITTSFRFDPVMFPRCIFTPAIYLEIMSTNKNLTLVVQALLINKYTQQANVDLEQHPAELSCTTQVH
jgi:hypothetical protein